MNVHGPPRHIDGPIRHDTRHNVTPRGLRQRVTPAAGGGVTSDISIVELPTIEPADISAGSADTQHTNERGGVIGGVVPAESHQYSTIGEERVRLPLIKQSKSNGSQDMSQNKAKSSRTVSQISSIDRYGRVRPKQNVRNPPNLFNPEPVPFSNNSITHSAIYHKVPLGPTNNEMGRSNVGSSYLLLNRSRGFVVRMNKFKCNIKLTEQEDRERMTEKEEEEVSSSFVVPLSRYNTTSYHHASRRLHIPITNDKLPTKTPTSSVQPLEQPSLPVCDTTENVCPIANNSAENALPAKN